MELLSLDPTFPDESTQDQDLSPHNNVLEDSLTNHDLELQKVSNETEPTNFYVLSDLR